MYTRAKYKTIYLNFWVITLNHKLCFLNVLGSRGNLVLFLPEKGYLSSSQSILVLLRLPIVRNLKQRKILFWRSGYTSIWKNCRLEHSLRWHPRIRASCYLGTGYLKYKSSWHYCVFFRAHPKPFELLF